MSVIDVNEILSSRDIVLDIYEVIAEYDIRLRRSPLINVKIYRISDSQYLAQANCEIWGPSQGNPYNHCTPYSSASDAISTLITGYESQYRPQDPNDVLFWVFPDGKLRQEDYLYIDGNGGYVPYKEVLRRREEWRTSNQE